MHRTDLQAQLAAIQHKLEQVKAKDTEFTEFGSSSHRYAMNPVLSKAELEQWQREHKIILPEPYAEFLLTIGNGGAGPYYGVYSLSTATSYTEPPALSLPAILRPRMPKAEWNQVIAPLIWDEDISDEQYEFTESQILGGMLCIGTQGCDYDMYLVLDGEYRGRVVYTNDFYEDAPFFFVYDLTFLDWYERWLDEIRLDYDRAWFGSRMPGDEQTLLHTYTHAADSDIQTDALNALFKFKQLSSEGLALLHQLVENDTVGQHTVTHEHRLIAIRLICKSTPEQGKPYVIQLLTSDYADHLLQGLQIVHHSRERWNTAEFAPIVVKQLDRIEQAEALRFAGYILHEQPGVTLRHYEHVLRSSDEEIQLAALYATRDCTDKLADVGLIEQLLADASPDMRHQMIMYWGILPHERLLPYYATMWPEYRNHPAFRLKFIEALQQLGLPEDYFEGNDE
ncbi:SMI1/KNR4 family protein [Paenibacillus wenxiniae]|uniref:SMI1/KNR4 family protein n=1 Tax=Paenibacillus wenxiniae TaxID=1636843 RepID=A0ABW4RFW0_9BACL